MPHVRSVNTNCSNVTVCLCISADHVPSQVKWAYCHFHYMQVKLHCCFVSVQWNKTMFLRNKGATYKSPIQHLFPYNISSWPQFAHNFLMATSSMIMHHHTKPSQTGFMNIKVGWKGFSKIHIVFLIKCLVSVYYIISSINKCINKRNRLIQVEKEI